MTPTPEERLILLTGATGYVGGRLLKALNAAGFPVRCLARVFAGMLRGVAVRALQLGGVPLPTEVGSHRDALRTGG